MSETLISNWNFLHNKKAIVSTLNLKYFISFLKFSSNQKMTITINKPVGFETSFPRDSVEFTWYFEYEEVKNLTEGKVSSLYSPTF